MTNGPTHGIGAGDDDRRLLAHVRPPEWRSPEPAALYDLVVVGGGTAGLVSAFLARALGARVALAERALLGGDCLVTGCVPSKALLRTARAAAEIRRAEELGVGASPTATRDDRLALARLRRLRADIAEHDAARRLEAAGIDVFFGEARFSGPAVVEVDGRILPFRRCILATGARPAIPAIPGLREARCLTPETFFGIAELPPSLAVIGGGPVGCELAQATARLGTTVTLVQRAERLLPRDDADAARVVERALAGDGVDVRLATTVLRVETRSGTTRLHLRDAAGAEQPLDVEAVLVAAGRRPQLEPLSLDRAGVAVDARGFVAVDDGLRTTNRRVHAAGDVAGLWQFTHAADAMARVAVQNALLPVRRRVSSLVVPWCTYTDPEVAHVGLGAAEAASRADVVTVTAQMEDVDRAILDGDTAGFARLHVRGRDGRILGATLVGSHAGESIGEAAIAIRSRLSAGRLEDTVHPYPTQAEALRRAAATWRRSRLRPWMPLLLQRWFRLLR